MARLICRLVSSGLLICLMAAPAGISTATAVQKPMQSAPALTTPQIAARLMEVRIRRLHLVRPDLIPYPIAYELDC